MRTDHPPGIPSVEILRGIASLSVAWFHIANGFNSELLRASGAYGWLGVEAFFVISGFIIPYSLWATGYRVASFPRFMARRLVRLEPPYLASVAMVVLLWIASAHTPGFQGKAPSIDVGQIAAHAFYIIPFTNYDWLSPVYWTLFYEFIFYIAVGISYPLLAGAHIAVVCLGFAGIFILVSLVSAPPWIALLFLIGIAGFRFKAGVDGASAALAVSTGSAVLLAICVGGSKGTLEGAVGIATLAAILFLPARIPAPLAFLGAISYSLYLVHVPIGGRIVNIGRRFAENSFSEAAIAFAALIVSILAATIFYRWLEAPARHASRRIKLNGSTR